MDRRVETGMITSITYVDSGLIVERINTWTDLGEIVDNVFIIDTTVGALDIFIYDNMDHFANDTIDYSAHYDRSDSFMDWHWEY